MCTSETSSCRLLLLFLALRDVVRVGEDVDEDEDVGDECCERAAVRKEERRRKRRVTEVKTARIGRYCGWLVGGWVGLDSYGVCAKEFDKFDLTSLNERKTWRGAPG